MAVIGRLDDQVDEVLIRPLDKARTREPRPEAEAPALDAPTPASPHAPAPERESARRADELPVWLL